MKRAEWVLVDSEMGRPLDCKVIDCGTSRAEAERGCPTLELEAPDGWRFDDAVHVLPCYGMKDLRERAAAALLTACPEDCDCRFEERGE